MKILDIGDIHWSFNNPERRKDNYCESLKRKLEEISVIAQDFDIVVQVGDLGHKKNKMTWIEFCMLARLLKSFGKRILVNPGNHDLFGGNYANWEVSPVGALAMSGAIEIIPPSGIVVEGRDGVKLLVRAVPFSYYNQPESYSFVADKSKVDFVVTLAHDMIFRESPPFDCHHIILDQIMERYEGDVLINGHLHNLNYRQDFGDRAFFQTGSISRGVLYFDDKDRPIVVTGIELTKGMPVKSWDIALKSVRPFGEVFDVNSYLKEKEADVSFAQFTDSVIAEVATVEQYDVQMLVRNTDEFKALSQDVRDVVAHYLEGVGA